MKKVVYARQMQQTDKTASDVYGIPSVILMENAAMACVKNIENTFALENLKVAVCCGCGNNGGDGFAIARLLYNKGCNVTVIVPDANADFSVNAKINFDIVKNLNIKTFDLTDSSQFSLAKHHITMSDVVIDALYGTGVNRDIEGIAYELIEHINSFARYVLSVDIPSGVDADDGSIHACGVNADETVTFAAYKYGLLAFPGADCAGKITVADISIPKSILDSSDITADVIEASDISINKRRQNTNKSHYGKVLIVAGSIGMTGAATLASTACLKSGAGLITLAVAESLNPILEEKLTEVMTVPLPDAGGKLSIAAKEKLELLIPKFDCVLFGPGLSNAPDIKDLLASVISKSKKHLIIDADGLNALSKDLSVLNNKNCNIILTPHSMEMARLCNISVKQVEEDRINTARNFAMQHGVYVILKGRHSVIATPEGICHINTIGNPGMATGGSGDVLAGMLAAFLPQCNNAEQATVNAVYLHALAGDIAKDTFGEYSMTPGDITDNIHKAIVQCEK